MKPAILPGNDNENDPPIGEIIKHLLISIPQRSPKTTRQRLADKWAKHSHPNKSKHCISDKYFGRFNKARKDRRVFCDRGSGAYLFKFS
jgi:hypothetical protein